MYDKVRCSLLEVERSPDAFHRSALLWCLWWWSGWWFVGFHPRCSPPLFVIPSHEDPRYSPSFPSSRARLPFSQLFSFAAKQNRSRYRRGSIRWSTFFSYLVTLIVSRRMICARKRLTKRDLDLRGLELIFLNVRTIKVVFCNSREKMRLKSRKYKVAMMQTILCTIYRLVSRRFL